MNIKSRLKKLESSQTIKGWCFCGKSLTGLWTDKTGVALNYCRKCKERFDVWANIAAEAQSFESLTDERLSL